MWLWKQKDKRHFPFGWEIVVLKAFVDNFGDEGYCIGGEHF